MVILCCTTVFEIESMFFMQRVIAAFFFFVELDCCPATAAIPTTKLKTEKDLAHLLVKHGCTSRGFQHEYKLFSTLRIILKEPYSAH